MREARLCKASKLQKKVQFLAGGCEVVWKCSLLILCCSLPGQSPRDDLERCKSCLKLAENIGLRAQSSQLEAAMPWHPAATHASATPAHPPLALSQPGRRLGTRRPEPLTGTQSLKSSGTPRTDTVPMAALSDLVKSLHHSQQKIVHWFYSYMCDSSYFPMLAFTNGGTVKY